MAIWKGCQPFWVADSNFAGFTGGLFIGRLLYYKLGPPEGLINLTGIASPRDA